MSDNGERSGGDSGVPGVPALIVGVGASAGGLDAYKQLLKLLPTDEGLAIILVQHLDPTHKSLLAELIDPSNPMPVREAEHGMELQRNTVYVIPPGTALGVREGAIELTVPEKEKGIRLPVDHLFRSLATEYGPDSAGVVLTGAGGDGSSGLREMKLAGALTVAQDPGTSTQAGMPQAAIDTGSVDLVLPISEIPAALVRFSKLPVSARMLDRGAERLEDRNLVQATLTDEELEALGTILEESAGFNLRVYKRGTVERRSLRRMALAGFDKMPVYLDHLRKDGEELQALVRDLLISVTSFNRDPSAFQALKSSVIEPLVSAANPGQTLRAWVAGCATGEEAYSLALAFLEAIDGTGKRLYLQVFATDIDSAALAVARQGSFPSGAVEALGNSRVERYFKPLDDHSYQLRPALRDAVSFAVHDLTKNPPFSRMDIVTCRNVLIYFRPRAQDQIMRAFHFALNPGGCLFLGTSEDATSRCDLFETLSKKWRIYRKIGAGRPPVPSAGHPPLSGRFAVVQEGNERAPDAPARAQQKPVTQEELARHAVLRARVPPTIVVGASGEILFMLGELRPYLRFPEGRPQLDLSSLVSEDLSTRARACLYKCRRDSQDVTAISSPDAGRDSPVRITASPAPELGDDAVILSFENHGERTQTTGRAESPGGDAVNEQLERELVATREDLQSTVGELEASQEKLRCSNEELMSMNEELQSANEELEATTEELRSLNEELTTVNSQLREKIGLIEVAHDDLTNFFASTNVATLFLDESLCIKRSTPAAAELLGIGSSDIGRNVGDIARELFQNDLVAESRAVLNHLVPRSHEVRTGNGRWITRQILPYRTSARRIEGVVVTFSDISEMKAATTRLEIREKQQGVVARLGMTALEAPDVQTFLEQAVPEIQEVLGTDFCKVLELQPGEEQFFVRAGIGWDEGIVGMAMVPNEPDSQGGFTIQHRDPVLVDDLLQERRFSGPALLRDHGVHSGMSCPIRYGDTVYGVLAVHCRKRRRFTREDADFLQSVAVVIASALQRHTAETFLQLEAAVGKALAVSESLIEALSEIHQGINSTLGECIVELWEPGEQDSGMVRSAMRCSSSFDCDAVEACLQPARFKAGEGPVGRASAARRSEWFTVRQTGVPVIRLDPIRLLGLSCGFAIPITEAGTTRAVITILCRDHHHADRGLLAGFDGVGRSIGDFVSSIDIKRRLRATVSDAPVGIANRTPDNRWIRVNQSLCEITGYTSGELIDRTPEDITHPEDIAGEEPLRIGNANRYVIEKRFIRKDGTSVWVCQNSSCVPRSSGGIEYWIDIIEDISGRRAADARLRESEARFRQILASSPVPLMVYDEENTILAISDSLTASTGYTLADIPTLDAWFSRAFPDRAVQMKQQMSDLRPVLWGGGPKERIAETEIRTRDGRVRTFLFTSAALEKSGDFPQQRIVVAADITEQRKNERDLIEASREKDEFIAMLGHELRNPLAALASAASLLGSGSLKPGMLDRVQAIIERQTGHMGKLLDGLLDISRVIQGKISIENQPTDLTAVVRDVLRDTHERAEMSPLEFVIVLPDSALWVDGDAVRLTQVVDNILSNAAKYTSPPGTITVRLEAERDTAVLTVEDTGDGIESELLARLFEPFRQGRQSFDRSRGGLGIGLALVHRLVALHGGTVTAASEGEGKGSCFTLRIPLTGNRPPGGGTPEVEDCAPYHILVVEDNPDAAELLVHTFELAGHKVTHAGTGLGIVPLARETHPDVVLCDLGLPDGMTGFDVAKLLRDQPEFATTPIVALSGYGRPEDRKRALKSGFDRHVTKPVSASQITSIISEIRSGKNVG